MNQQFTVNENFFKTWTEKSAYVLGWIVSDGCINYIPKKKYEIRFELKDFDAIRLIRQLMDSNHPIHKRQDKNSVLYGLFINNKKLVKQLLDLGITPNKTYRLHFPKIPHEYKKHFIRGFFDGDGSAFLLNKTKNRKQLNSMFCSVSKEFLKEIGEFLREEIDLIPKIYKEKENFYKLRYGGKESVALYKYLYEQAHFYLKRKKEIFEQGMELKAGTGIANCKRCGKEIVRVSSRTKWCGDCKKVVQKEQWKAKYERKKARQNQEV
jgi:intein/homing endonuclease